MNTQPKEEQKIKTQEQLDDENYSAVEYHKKVFSLSSQELSDLLPFEEATKFIITLQIIGGIAQKAKDNYVGNQVLSRLGVVQSEDTKFNYDLSKAKVIVYEPRHFCASCHIKKAAYKYGDKLFCQNCIEKEQKAATVTPEEKTKKKKE